MALGELISKWAHNAPLPLTVLFPAAFVVGITTIIALNVLSQLLSKPDPRLPPVVFHWVPFFGNMISFGMDPIKFLSDCQAKYGEVFTFIMFGRRMTYFMGPDGNNFVLNSKISHVSADEAYKQMTTPVFGKDVVYDVPNAKFMEQKKFIKSGISTDNLKLYVGFIQQEVEDYIKRYLDNEEGHMEIAKDIATLIIMTASRCLMGKEIRAQLDEGVAQLYHDLDKGFQPINFLFPNLPLPSYRRRDIAQKKMADLFISIVQKRRESGDFDNNDMVQSLMEQRYKDGSPIPDYQIAHILIALLFGGQHTSSTTSCWSILRIAENRKLLNALREEQIRVLGDLESPLTFEALKEMQLLDSVVRETLRVHPPIFQLVRKVIRPVEYTKTGHIIPAGHYATIAPAVSSLSEEYFTEGKKYNPWRWTSTRENAEKDFATLQEDNKEWDLSESGQVLGGSARSPYLPFGGGRHRCIGENFAYVQVKTVLATFIRYFDIELVDEFPKPDYSSMVVMPPHDIKIKYRLRK
ncbi:uncharacterized protein VTP21DRAFT_1779 [Calcarisporiella thermophila]|uniref:uncharacterized protein n=1 Tax=Calcarisporiella thermophila TaxID=911321 RepID=UPI003742E586